MAVSEKAKEKLDEAGREVRDAIDSLKREVAELRGKVRERLKGTGEEMRQSAEELSGEVKRLSDRVRDLVPGRRRKSRLPVRVERFGWPGPGWWPDPYVEFRRAAERLFGDLPGAYPPAGRRGMPGTPRPRVDMRETDEEIRITAELPGVDKDDIHVSVAEDRIAIRGEKREEGEEKGRGWYRLERSYGSFHRSFELPCEVDADRVEASFRKGVLTVRLPKTAAARERRRRIPIRTG